jgi:EamA domain-containing membrane protein RarD
MTAGYIVMTVIIAIVAMVFFLNLERHQTVKGQDFTKDTHWLVWVGVFLTTPLIWFLQIFGWKAERPRAKGTDYSKRPWT